MGEFYACCGPFLVLTRVFRLLTRGGGKRDDEDNTTGNACGSGPGGLGVGITRECHGNQCNDT